MRATPRASVVLALLSLPALASDHKPYILPTIEDMSQALDAARLAWGYSTSEPISFRFDSLNPCKLGPWGNPVIAVTQALESESKISFSEGEAAVSQGRSWVIRINSNCDWRRLDIQATVLHEYGRIILGVGYKSSDVNSIMYGMVTGNQWITESDREAVRGRNASVLH